MNKFKKYLSTLFLIPLLFLGGCYSFTGGSIPSHLKSLQITNVVDNSGYGVPLVKDDFTNKLNNRFRSDNSFQIVLQNGNARLSVTILSIKDDPVSIGIQNKNELETQRKITLTCKAEYFDNVKKKQIFEKTFSNFDVFSLSGNVQQNRNEKILKSLDQICDDIIVAVVSGW